MTEKVETAIQDGKGIFKVNEYNRSFYCLKSKPDIKLWLANDNRSLLLDGKWNDHLYLWAIQVRDDVIRDILLRDRIQEEDARADARAKAEAKVKEMLESEDVSSREKPIGALEKEKAAEPGRPARIGPEQETVSSLERIRIAEQSRLIDSEEVDDSQKGLGEQEPSEDDEEEAVEDEKGASPFSKKDHQTAMDIISPYKSYREYARAKFSRYMRIGDAIMKDGRFYKAADAFTLAAIYTSEDPMPYGSRGIALFAAGEYLASMDYLQRAFDLSDVYAAKKIDLVSLIGRETFDKRLSELITCCKASDISQFHLLASYIQYQTLLIHTFHLKRFAK